MKWKIHIGAAVPIILNYDSDIENVARKVIKHTKVWQNMDQPLKTGDLEQDDAISIFVSHFYLPQWVPSDGYSLRLLTTLCNIPLIKDGNTKIICNKERDIGIIATGGAQI